MFRRNKKSEAVYEKSARKFFTHKEITQRIKHLKNLVKTLPTAQIQKFFSDYHSQIFYTFYDSFDSEVRSKCKIFYILHQIGSLGHTKDLENHFGSWLICQSLFVHTGSMRVYVSSLSRAIFLVGLIRDLLHPKNIFQLQIYGLRMFLIWYQILGNSATEECRELFIHLVPAIGEVHDFYKKTKGTIAFANNNFAISYSRTRQDVRITSYTFLLPWRYFSGTNANFDFGQHG
ncbi:unnamed protein product [Dibothriocephalus latus]|uniref:Uncharacterized protein n=1 Tax=Dibothriocephalus latus TaxID=60516 RepID=A0A3P7KY89_DIBLA|nr:unnamed protein product [Dibothriocephalus latus]